MTTIEQLNAVLIENDEIKKENQRMRDGIQWAIDNGLTAGFDAKTPDEFCDEVLPNTGREPRRPNL